MSNDNMAEAERRIAECARTRVIMLDLGDLGLDSLPASLGGLSHLRFLVLGEMMPVWQNGQVKWQWQYDRPPPALIDLEPLRGLTNLNWLDLSSSKRVASLEPLRGLTSLTALNLSKCDRMISLEPLRKLTNLTSLDLSFNLFRKSLEVLTSLGNLRTLDLSHCCVTSLEPLGGLTNLVWLNLDSCWDVTSLEPLRRLTNLTWLDVSSCRRRISLEVIGSLTNLTSLNLRLCSRVDSLGLLKLLINLISLNLYYCSVTSLDPLRGLPKLASLYLGGCSDLTSLEPVRNLGNLGLLDLSDCRGLTSLEPLRELANLTSLNLSNCTEIPLEPLRDFINLTSLDLTCCGTSSLELLRGLTKLTSLRLHNCKGVISLEPLRSLTKLTSLDLSGCSGVSSLEPLRKLANLTSLDLSGCRGAFAPVRSLLVHLRELSLEGAAFIDLPANIMGKQFGVTVVEQVRQYFQALQGQQTEDGAEFAVEKLSPQPRGGTSTPLTILFVAANPSDGLRLNQDREYRAIDEALRSAGLLSRVRLIQVPAAQPGDLQPRLLEYTPHIVHFSAHGTAGGGVGLTNASNKTAAISTETLVRLFAALAEDAPRLVVLSYCQSEPTAQALVQHVDFAVGFPGQPRVSPAIAFAASLVRALCFGSIKQAFDLGCNAVDLEVPDARAEDRPRLHCRAGLRPESVTLFAPGHPS